jgi:hypothetical protein
MSTFLHHAASLPQRWTSRWCPRHSGTVNSSLTFRPRARLCMKGHLDWLAAVFFGSACRMTTFPSIRHPFRAAAVIRSQNRQNSPRHYRSSAGGVGQSVRASCAVAAQFRDPHVRRCACNRVMRQMPFCAIMYECEALVSENERTSISCAAGNVDRYTAALLRLPQRATPQRMSTSLLIERRSCRFKCVWHCVPLLHIPKPRFRG